MAKNAARPPKAKSLNRSLHAAKATKQDEFYTQLSDIEKELKHYTAYFKGKTVLCNCDDPRVSNFFKPGRVGVRTHRFVLTRTEDGG